MDSAGQLTPEDWQHLVGGDFAELGGAEQPVLFVGDDWLAVPRADGEEVPEAIEVGSNSRGAWAKVPKSAVTRRFRRTVEATWRGEPVTVVGPVLDGTVRLNYERSPERARELGMTGNRTDFWHVRVPCGEVELGRVVETDLGA